MRDGVRFSLKCPESCEGEMISSLRLEDNRMELQKIETGNTPKPQVTPIKQEELQRDFDYMLAERFTKRMLQEGLISEEEYVSIMNKNRDNFSPSFSALI